MDTLQSLIQSGAPGIAVTLTLADLRQAMSELATMVADEVSGRMAGPAPVPAPAPRMLTADEVCARLGVSKQTMWRWNKMGYLPAVKVGSHVRYRPEDVDYVEGRRQHGTQRGQALQQ